MAGDTLEQLLGQVQTYKAGSDKATQEIVAALGAQAAISTSASDTFTQQAGDDVTVQTAKNAADYATQLARVRAANMQGVNLKGQSEVLTALSSAAADAQTRKDAALAEIQRKDSVGFIDSPLEYLMNQFTVNSDIAKHNIANAQLESAQNRIMAVNQAAQTTIQTQNAINEPLTAASMEASARSAAVTATIAAKNAQIQALSYGTKGIEFALNAKKEVLALGFQEQSAKNAAIHTEIALQQLEQSKIEFSARQEEYAAKRDDREEQKQLGQSFIDTVNLGRVALLGASAPAIDDMSGKMMLATLKSKGKLSDQMQTFYDAGERTRLAGVPMLGTTPAQAATTIRTVNPQLNSTQGPIKALLGAAATDTVNAIQAAESGLPGKNANPIFAGLNSKDAASKETAYNGRAQQILEGYSAVVKEGASDNPYQIASINQLAANSSTVQALPVYQKVFAPLIKQGTQLALNDPRILSLVGDAVSKGTITHAEALELTTIAHVGVTANLAMRNFPGFGLVPSRSYNVSVETAPHAFNSTEIVDLTKADALSRALIKSQSAVLSTTLLGTVNKQIGNIGLNMLSSGLTGAGKGISNGMDTLFAPQPQAAQDISNWANDASAGMEGVMNNLPHASPPTQQSASGKIKFPAKQ